MILKEAAEALSVSIPTVKKYLAELNLTDQVQKEGRSLSIPPEVFDQLKKAIPQKKTSKNPSPTAEQTTPSKGAEQEVAQQSASQQSKTADNPAESPNVDSYLKPLSRLEKEVEHLMTENQRLAEEKNTLQDKFDYLDNATTKELNEKDAYLKQYENTIDFLRTQINTFNALPWWKKAHTQIPLD